MSTSLRSLLESGVLHLGNQIGPFHSRVEKPDSGRAVGPFSFDVKHNWLARRDTLYPEVV